MHKGFSLESYSVVVINKLHFIKFYADVHRFYNMVSEGNMGTKLWFVTDGTTALGCFDTKIDAEEFKDQFGDDDDYNYYELYTILLDELEDYPDEYELAMEEGLV